MKTKNDDYVLIGEAARYLSVSVATLRRWDSSGKVRSKRIDSKNRYFSLRELRKIRMKQKLRVGEVSLLIGVSETSIRRLVAKGVLASTRGANGERLFAPSSVRKYILGKTSTAGRKIESLQVNTSSVLEVPAQVEVRRRSVVDEINGLLFGEVGLAWAMVWLILVVGLSGILPVLSDSVLSRYVLGISDSRVGIVFGQ